MAPLDGQWPTKTPQAGGSSQSSQTSDARLSPGCRHIGKKDLMFNDASPDLQIDPVSGEVYADGARLHCEPLETFTLSRKYFLS